MLGSPYLANLACWPETVERQTDAPPMIWINQPCSTRRRISILMEKCLD
jgi:hypothetical protein